MRFLLLLCFFLPLARAEVSIETHDLQFEYGLAYHTLRGKQESNGSTGQLSSPLYPYWLAGYTFRTSRSTALRLFGGVHFVKFDEPKFGNLIGEKQELVQYGAEFSHKVGPLMKWGFFVMRQDHPLYFAKDPTHFEVVRSGFAQSGVHLSLSQRRRIGLLWGMGLRGYALFPVHGGNVVTETGGGGEGYARLGWVGPLGTMYHLKGFYQLSTAPNAQAIFTHQILGYSLTIQWSF